MAALAGTRTVNTASCSLVCQRQANISKGACCWHTSPTIISRPPALSNQMESTLSSRNNFSGCSTKGGPSRLAVSCGVSSRGISSSSVSSVAVLGESTAAPAPLDSLFANSSVSAGSDEGDADLSSGSGFRCPISPRRVAHSCLVLLKLAMRPPLLVSAIPPPSPSRARFVRLYRSAGARN